MFISFTVIEALEKVRGSIEDNLQYVKCRLLDNEEDEELLKEKNILEQQLDLIDLFVVLENDKEVNCDDEVSE